MSTFPKVSYKIPSNLVDTLNGMAHTSQKIRFLTKNGYNKYQVSKMLNIRYQWVYNVLNQNLKNQ